MLQFLFYSEDQAMPVRVGQGLKEGAVLCAASHLGKKPGQGSPDRAFLLLITWEEVTGYRTPSLRVRMVPVERS